MNVNHNATHMFIKTMAFAVVALGTASAQNVEMRMSSQEAQVGEPVQIEITATGKSQARLLDSPAVDGLEVVSQSDQFQMQMQFPGFGMQVTTTHMLVVVPTREGEFQIPPLRLRLDGKVFKTSPQTLTVTPDTGGVPVRPGIPVPPGGGRGASPGTQVQPFVPPSARQQTAPQEPSRPSASQDVRTHFGEIIIPQETAYVGEVVPTDLRFYVLAQLPAEFSDRVNFSGEGFTVGRMAPLPVTRRDLGDTPYACRVFRTSITPAKVGTLEIPNASVDARVQVPVSNPFGNDDFFGGMMRNFGMADVREVEIPTNRATLEVKALPKDGRPEDFAGAVGDFQIRVEATPEKSEPGEPVTLTVTLSGRGNFEAMGSPELVDAEGWRVYDPAESFTPSPTDPIGLHGEKTFQFTLVAREDQKATPPVRFSFFDPQEEEYVTLEGPPVAVDARGSGRKAPVMATTDAAATPEPTESPAPAATGEDLSRDTKSASFEPAGWHPGFWVAGGALALLWTAGLAVLLLKRHHSNPATARAAALKSLRSGLKGLENPGLPMEDFLSRAYTFLEGRLGGVELSSLPLSGQASTAIEILISAHGAAHYSTQRPPDLPVERRREIVTALREVDSAMNQNHK
jgi:hypothetical protein